MKTKPSTSTVAPATRTALKALIDADRGISRAHRAAILRALDDPPGATPSYLTATDAAAELGVATITVCRWLDAGRLAGFRVGDRTTVVSSTSVAALKTHLAKRPPPVKQAGDPPPKVKRPGDPLPDRYDAMTIAHCVNETRKRRQMV